MYIVLYILFICVTLQVNAAQGLLFSGFLNFAADYLVGLLGWGDSTVVRPLPKKDNTKKE
jgi:hypothetical protein